MTKRPLRILFVASEMAPLAKTGGLADVVSALSAQLRLRGHDVRVVLPFYASIRDNLRAYGSALPSMGVPMGGHTEWCSVAMVQGPGNVPVYLLEHHGFYSREGFYNDASMGDYPDNPRRFGFLCRAALRLCHDTGFEPDILHAHDWQAGLLPWAARQPDSPLARRPHSVLTIHNLAYQGVYPAFHGELLGIPEELLGGDGFGWYGKLGLLKGGLLFADALNTVSPGFAREIQQPGGGFGLEEILQSRRDDLFGILNGIDGEEWSPGKDPYLPTPYTAKKMAGKKDCKRALQESLNLDVEKGTPLFGLVGRFTQQKGYHLALNALERLLPEGNMQVAVLGSGDPTLGEAFTALAARHPGAVGLHVGYSNQLAHLIEAGSDFFLMPSLFEPCGLNQMYSQRYGTLPIVHATGGLDDTVDHADEASDTGTGFKFHTPTPAALEAALREAMRLWRENPAFLRRMQERAMARDFSWDRSVKEYEALYRHAMKEPAPR